MVWPGPASGERAPEAAVTVPVPRWLGSWASGRSGVERWVDGAVIASTCRVYGPATRVGDVLVGIG
jgi:hypothetical protein